MNPKNAHFTASATLLATRQDPDPVDIHAQIELIIRAVAFRLGISERAITTKQKAENNLKAFQLTLWLIDSLVECSYNNIANYFLIPLGEARHQNLTALESINQEIINCTELGQMAIPLKTELEYQLAAQSDH